MRRIVIIQGHPEPAGHLGLALTEAYAEGARATGHEVRLVTPSQLEFPLLRSQQDFEHGTPPPAIADAQATLAWAEHWVVAMPVWLGDMPALLKGFFEQALRPGFAFDYHAKGLPTASLGGRSARIIATVGMPSLVFRWWYGGGGVSVLERNILRFAGLGPVRTSLIGTVAAMPPARAEAWLGRMRALGGAAH
jgi:putative NADPH-quinone reductase